MESLSKREIVLKYSEEIDSMVRDIRRWITDTDPPPEPDRILRHTEDVFFSSGLPERTAIREMSAVISAVYVRVSGKYGLLKTLLEDPSVNEIMVNGPDMIFVEKDRRLMRIDDSFIS